MPRILFDHQIFSLQRYGGISRYFANLHAAIQKSTGFSSKIGLLYSRNYYAKDVAAPLDNFMGKWLLDTQVKNYKWNKKYSKLLIRQNSFDVLHPTYYDPYFLKRLKKPFVITVHDMIHELMPEFFPPGDVDSRNKKICVEQAGYIIAISETTKKDLVRLWGVDENRVTVIHHGYHNYRPEVATAAAGPEGDYLLYVGDRRGYKNFNRFALALSPLLRQHAGLKLVCAGGGAFSPGENGLLNKLEIAGKVIQVSADDSLLRQLYARARAFIFPSLYEGFGLPLLEAFQNNCPVICSDTACFREVVADAGAFFNPADEHSMLVGIENVLNDTGLAAQLVRKGKERLPLFTPERCFDQTMALYRQVAG